MIDCRNFLTITCITYKKTLMLSKKIQLNNEEFEFKRYFISLIENNFIILSIKTIYFNFFNLINLLMNYLKSIISLKTSQNVFIIDKCIILIKKTN